MRPYSAPLIAGRYNVFQNDPPVSSGAKIESALAGTPEILQEVYPGPLRERLKQKALLHEVDWRNDNTPALERVEILFGTWGMPMHDAAFLNRLPALKAVFYAAGSVKTFATPELFTRGITLCSAGGANAVPVAEYAVAAIILSLKRIWQHLLKTRRTHSWERLSIPGAYRSTVGLVSLGAVGRLTAQKLEEYEFQVLACDPYISQKQAGALGVRLVSLEEIFQNSDVISLHTPLLPETENLITARLLRLMKPGATLLNTSRGAIINEADLCEVLGERDDLTALLDVTYPEPPPPDSPLFRLDNVFLTPHISGSRGAEIRRMGEWMVEEFERYARGEPLQHEVRQEMLRIMA